MVNLTRIYTRTGDDGSTHLGDFSRTRKTDPRLVAYADVDEANSAIGVAVAAGAAGGLDPDLATLLRRIQNDLFDVGADLCTPLVEPAPEDATTAAGRPVAAPLRVTEAYVEELESACDRYNDDLEPLRSFILPGGTLLAAHLHVARTVARRAERSIWSAIEAYGADAAPWTPEGTPARGVGGVNPLAARYVNRLSDLLFILGRHANQPTGDILWTPGGNRGRSEPGTAEAGS